MYQFTQKEREAMAEFSEKDDKGFLIKTALSNIPQETKSALINKRMAELLSLDEIPQQLMENPAINRATFEKWFKEWDGKEDMPGYKSYFMGMAAIKYASGFDFLQPDGKTEVHIPMISQEVINERFKNGKMCPEEIENDIVHNRNSKWAQSIAAIPTEIVAEYAEKTANIPGNIACFSPAQQRSIPKDTIYAIASLQGLKRSHLDQDIAKTVPYEIASPTEEGKAALEQYNKDLTKYYEYQNKSKFAKVFAKQPKFPDKDALPDNVFANCELREKFFRIVEKNMESHFKSMCEGLGLEQEVPAELIECFDKNVDELDHVVKNRREVAVKKIVEKFVDNKQEQAVDNIAKREVKVKKAMDDLGMSR